MEETMKYLCLAYGAEKDWMRCAKKNKAPFWHRMKRWGGEEFLRQCRPR
jgi:hypothetical protein